MALSKIGAAGTSGFGRRNLIINGAMQVAQRGTSFSATGTIYTLDRWEVNVGNSDCTTTQEEFTVGQTDVPNNPVNYIKIAKNGETEQAQLRQKIEDVRLLSSETVTLSFWANTSSTLELDVFQNFGSGGSTQVQDLDGGAFTVVETNNSWSKYVITHTLGSVTGKTIGSGSYILFRIVEQASTTNDFSATQVQLEVGSTATEFEHRSFGEELALCQRYFQKFTSEDNAYQEYCIVATYASTEGQGNFRLPVVMRDAPDAEVSGSFQLAGSGLHTCSQVNPGQLTKWGCRIGTVHGSGTLTNGCYRLRSANNTSSYIEFDAEL